MSEGLGTHGCFNGAKRTPVVGSAKGSGVRSVQSYRDDHKFDLLLMALVKTDDI